jgi:hypothetical protein
MRQQPPPPPHLLLQVFVDVTIFSCFLFHSNWIHHRRCRRRWMKVAHFLFPFPFLLFKNGAAVAVASACSWLSVKESIIS